jgi:hypothetical protein
MALCFVVIMVAAGNQEHFPWAMAMGEIDQSNFVLVLSRSYHAVWR